MYTKFCKVCGKAKTHNDEGCITCAKNKQSIASALNKADFRQLSYSKLIKISRIIKGK